MTRLENRCYTVSIPSRHYALSLQHFTCELPWSRYIEFKKRFLFSKRKFLQSIQFARQSGPGRDIRNKSAQQMKCSKFPPVSFFRSIPRAPLNNSKIFYFFFFFYYKIISVLRGLRAISSNASSTFTWMLSIVKPYRLFGI